MAGGTRTTPLERDSTTSPGPGLVFQKHNVSVYAGRSARQPLERLGARRVEEEAALVDEERRGRELKRPADAVLGEHDGRTEPLDGVEEERGAFGIELRRRLVEEQQLRLQRERRRQADALELAAGELDRLAPPADGARPTDASARSTRGQISAGGTPRFSSPNATSFARDRHHDLVLRILEDGRHRAGELGRSVAARVEPGDDDPAGEAATVEVRHEPGERAQERRLPGARRAEERDDLPSSSSSETPRSAGGDAGYENASPLTGLEPQRRHEDEQRRRAGRRAGPACSRAAAARASRPGRPKPRASIASARLDARSSEPATSGESSVA